MIVSKKLEGILVLLLIVGGIVLFGWAPAYATGMVVLGLAYFIYTKRGAVYVVMANFGFRKGGLPLALSWFRKAYLTRTMDVQTEVTYGFLLLKSGDVDEGEKVLSTLVGRLIKEGRSRELPLARGYLSLAQWKKGDLQGAIENLSELLEGGYRTGSLYGSLGYFLLEKGDLDRALELNLEAAQYDDRDKVIMDNLGCTYFLRNDPAEAEKIYDKLIALEPGFPEAWHNYGRVLSALGKKDEARQAFAKALELPFNALSTVTKDEVERAFLACRP